MYYWIAILIYTSLWWPKKTKVDLGWGILSNMVYSPDLVSSDYDLFQLKLHTLRDQKFKDVFSDQNFIIYFVESKLE